jgi:hypothetical protein
MRPQLYALAVDDPAEISRTEHAEPWTGTRPGRVCSPVAMFAGDKKHLGDAESQRSTSHEQCKADI